MLIYLDNVQSVGPDSPGARAATRRRGVERGLNENYARELLELHTLGVDGGYGQRDVVELAKILTGWTLDRRRRERGLEVFSFQPRVHQPGLKTVLGERYGPGGVDEGEAAIRDLCRHPSTARFVSAKLVRHFVSDDPPTPAVDRLSRVFMESGGDLLEVGRALITLEEAWDPDRRKFRTPQDWVVAALRSIRAPDAAPQGARILRQLRQPLWAPPSPKGYGDTTAEWADPDALMNRAELARTLGARLSRTGLRPSKLIEVTHLEKDDPLPELVDDDGIPREERLALVFGGPAFQWR